MCGTKLILVCRRSNELQVSKPKPNYKYKLVKLKQILNTKTQKKASYMCVNTTTTLLNNLTTVR